MKSNICKNKEMPLEENKENCNKNRYTDQTYTK